MSNVDIRSFRQCSVREISRAAWIYAHLRTKVYNGMCLHRHTTSLEFEDVGEKYEALLQVCELLSCPMRYAQSILRLLKGSGRHIVITTVAFEANSDENEFDDEWGVQDEPEEEEREEEPDSEEFFTRSHRNNQLLHQLDNQGKQIVYLLSHRGIRRRSELIFSNNKRRDTLPIQERGVTAEWAVGVAHHYHGTSVKWARFLTHLQIFYLVALCPR